MPAVATPRLTATDPEEIALGITPVAEEPDERGYAERVTKELGNTVLQEKIEQKLLPNIQLDLLSILREHGVKLYREKDVKRYKQARIDVATKLTAWQKLGVTLVWAGIVSFVLSGLAALFGLISSEAFGFTGLGMAGACLLSVILSNEVDAYWRPYEIGYYPREIPKTVLDLAQMLKQAAPKVRFEIDEFVIERRPFDPLLYVYLGPAKYCIAVWDEPDFHAELVE